MSDRPKYTNRGSEVWERTEDGQRELFAADAVARLTDLERQRDAYVETLRDLLNFAYERERDYIRERHPELAQEK